MHLETLTLYLMQRPRVRILFRELARINRRLLLRIRLPAAKHRGRRVIVAVRVILLLLLPVGTARRSIGLAAGSQQY
jgi:hypothetical protein